MSVIKYIPNRVIDSDGIADGASVYLYQSGTTTPISLYLDDAFTTPTTNPYIVSAGAEVPKLYYNYVGDVRLLVVSAAGNVINEDPYAAPYLVAEDLTPYALSANVNTSLSNRVQKALTRTALAAITDTTIPAILAESGREGSFVFDNSNFVTKLGATLSTIDPLQGIYVAPSTDTSGASGAWVRKDDYHFAEHFGAVGDGVTDDSAKINTALVTLNTLGLSCLDLTPGKTYNAGTTTITFKSNILLRGRKSVISSSAAYVIGDTSSTSGHGIEGVKFVQTAGVGTKYLFDINGTDWKLLDTNWVCSPSVHGVLGYLRDTTANGYIRGFKSSGSDGVFVSGHDHLITDFDLTNGGGTDDGWVLKAAGTVSPAKSIATYNIKISNGTAHGFGNAVSFGSEVGLGSSTSDPTYSNFVRNVTVSDVIAEGCSAFTYIKPGGSTANYCDGTVQGLTFNNCQLVDDSASPKAKWFAQISPGRGARVRNVRFNNCTARYRAPDRSTGANAGIFINGLTYPGGTAASEIDGIFVNGISIVDPNGGVANGGTAPGYPIDFFVFVDASTGAGGTATNIKRVEVNELYGNGCARAGVSITANATVVGPIIFRNPAIINYSAAELGSTDRAAILTSSNVEVTGLHAVPSSAAVAGTRGVMGDNQPDKTKTILDPTGQKHIPIGDVAATTAFRASIIIDRDCWLSSVWFCNNAAIAANPTNMVTVEVLNRSTGAIAVSKNSNTGFAVAANTPVSINGATQLTGANAYIAKGTNLTITVTTAGTTTLQGASLQLRTVPYTAMS